MSISPITRSIISDAASVPETFSSWHNCMSKAYCKWPAIVGIVIGSLILLSVVFCLVQCLGGDRRSRSAKGDYSQMAPAPYGGYQPPAAQMAWAHAGPATATFDTSKKDTEDSLPPMPSWDTARTRHVQDASQAEPKHGDDVEMGRLGPQQTGWVSRDGYSQVPGEGARSPTLPGYLQQGQPDPSTHAYASDLGAQRMNQSAAYPGGFDQQVGSPAPTYHTYAVAPVADRVGGAEGPSPSHYHYRSPPAQLPSYAPPADATTLYEQSHYARSYGHQAASAPPMSGARAANYGEEAVHSVNNAYNNSYATPQHSQQLPSQLQVARKAVPGSMREV
ncbi:hypothetical protein DV737_g1205, partial [Chaetothyriales sp. CBS 132003]